MPLSPAGKTHKISTHYTYLFIEESNAIFYHQESNFQSSEASDISCPWSPNGNLRTFTTNLGESTTLSFTSSSEGTFQWQENGGSSNHGSFTLSDASVCFAPSSLSEDSMITGTTTYIFNENGVAKIRSTTGSQDSNDGFVKSGNNEIVVNIPAHADGMKSTLYKIAFSSTGRGSLSKGGCGSFQYFIDGSIQPSTKEWIWFDEYPLV